MKRNMRAAELRRLAWLAHTGYLCVGSDTTAVEEILDLTEYHVLEVPIVPKASPPHGERLTMACQLFASAAMSEAEGLES